ncbi:MAG: NusA-like transcription termination signal-binding factor [Thaumarchaeota archaeon]|jgi:N utilization substance protein A|nr:NusA-like transcription termination signal-binding factor [Nitrososphaerota archaeon]
MVTQRIKLTSEELGLMSLFQNVSGAGVRDCVIDEKNGRVIYVVNPGEMGRAIGKNGIVVKTLQRLVGKPVELVEYSDDPKTFIKNALEPKYVLDVRLTEKLDGSKIAVVVVDAKKKSAVVGRNGKNAEKARLLAKRYFQIANVHIVSQ